MRYNRLGSSGLLVSELCLGTMTFGKAHAIASVGGIDQPAADALVRTALDAGINFFDTANVYTNGDSEQIVGQSIRNLGIGRDEIVVATKAFNRTGPGPNRRGASRYALHTALDDSLRRLKLDHVDLYQMHGFDPLTPLEETLRTLDDFVRSGKVRYIGVSNYSAWQLSKALGICAKDGLTAPVSMQSYYSLNGRDLEREVVPMLRHENVALMAWSPLAGGALSGKYTREGGEGRRNEATFPPVHGERTHVIVDVLREVAERRGCTVAQAALAWLLHQPVVTSVIIGVKNDAQLQDNLGSCAVDLTDEDLAALAAVSALPDEYPGWMQEVQRRYSYPARPSPRRR